MILLLASDRPSILSCAVLFVVWLLFIAVVGDD